MAGSVVDLLRDEPLRLRLGKNGAMDARRQFDLNRQVEEYLGWYYEIAERWKAERLSSRTVEGKIPVGLPLSRISPVA
jgi:hypothetical protein